MSDDDSPEQADHSTSHEVKEAVHGSGREFRKGTDIVMTTPIVTNPSDTPIEAPQALLPPTQEPPAPAAAPEITE